MNKSARPSGPGIQTAAYPHLTSILVRNVDPDRKFLHVVRVPAYTTPSAAPHGLRNRRMFHFIRRSRRRSRFLEVAQVCGANPLSMMILSLGVVKANGAFCCWGGAGRHAPLEHGSRI
jgi:hypothetical protein